MKRDQRTSPRDLLFQVSDHSRRSLAVAGLGQLVAQGTELLLSRSLVRAFSRGRAASQDDDLVVLDLDPAKFIDLPFFETKNLKYDPVAFKEAQAAVVEA